VASGWANVDNLGEIVARAIDYTNIILRRMPTYRDAAVKGLRTLRDALAAKSPENPAIRELDAYLETLQGSRPDKLR